MKNFFSSPFVTFFLVPIVIPTLLTLLLSFLGKERTKLEWILNEKVLIANALHIPGLEVLFCGQKVEEELYKSTITICNSGNRTLDKNDFIEKNFIHIWVNSKVLSHLGNINCTEMGTGAEITDINDKECNLNFNILRKKQSIELSFLHTGELKLEAKMREGQDCFKEEKLPYRERLRRKVFVFASALVYVMFLVYGVLIFYYNWFPSYPFVKTGLVVVFILNIFSSIIFLLYRKNFKE